MSDRPYISVVIVGRNDDYGDNFLQRINTFVRSLDHQVQAYTGMFELIVVEWNPLPDNPTLSQVLKDTVNLDVRVITVGTDLHQQFGSDRPVLEYHGKNVGIRRARGEFVLVTNPDIVFSSALVHELAQRKLRSNTVYRTDRFDFDCAGINDVPVQDLESFAVQKSFVMHGMLHQGSISVELSDIKTVDQLPKSVIAPGVMHTNGCGDFMLASREAWYTARGLYETLEHRWHIDSISLMYMQRIGLHQHVFVSPCCIFHQDHPRAPADIEYHALDWTRVMNEPRATSWGLATHTLGETEKEIM